MTNWFAQRKITAETLQYNQVQECALQDRQGTIIPAVAVVFKYLHGISQVKLRTLDKQYKHYFAVKGESTLYGLAQLELSPTLIIVEGIAHAVSGHHTAW